MQRLELSFVVSHISRKTSEMWGTRPYPSRKAVAFKRQIVSVTVFERKHRKAGRSVAHEMADIGLRITLQIQRPRRPLSLFVVLILRQPDQPSSGLGPRQA